MFRQRYRVVVAARTGRTVRPAGSASPVWIEGMDVRAVPVFGAEVDQLAGIYPHTPGGQIAFELFGPSAFALTVGSEFDLTVT